MVIWIVMAVLAAAALLPVLAPLARPRASAVAGSAQAVAIYRDQLAEIDRDVDRGTLAGNEADAARLEISRRLLKAGEDKGSATDGDSRWRRGVTVAIIAMPLAAVALYLALGAPHLPGQALADRAPVDDTQDVGVLVAAVETHLTANPDDGEGWEVLAPIYVRLGRYEDAVAAYGNAIRLLGSTAERQLQLGDAIVRGTQGTMTPEAQAAFETAASLAPDDPRPRFYLAMALSQEGKREEAIAAWRALIDSAPDGATWRPAAEAELARLEAPPTTAPADLSPEDQSAMIEGMVASLAARLADNPDDAEGWARLVRSYVVLGRPDEAQAALDRARATFADNPAKRQTVERAARAAGLAEASP